MRWRRPRELLFRGGQELRNISLWLKPPPLPSEPSTIELPLPDPSAAAARIGNSAVAKEIVGVAENILEHRFPLLGLEIETGDEIRWRRDYQSGKETGLAYFRRIPYLDAARVGDHKVIWELNRHQHLVLLAQAWRISGRQEFPDEIGREVDSWLDANPFQRGINWCSALEVAFRSISWIWILHLAGDAIEAGIRRRMLEGLYRHGLHLACNLSFYFSPNTHLLGEAVALHALGKLFRGIDRADAWESTGARVLAEQMDRQVQDDGSHFEQSTYYHVYALDMFLFHGILARPPVSYRGELEKMGEYLNAWLGRARSLPLVGDDDGGRFFYPVGAKERYGLATLAACGAFLGRPEWIADEDAYAEQAAWWLTESTESRRMGEAKNESRLFRDAGAALMTAGLAFCAVDAGPFGAYRAGHSHADTLSIIARHGTRELLIDPGTFTYVADPHWRDVFRGTAAHNTIRIAGLDQADPAGPFGWAHPPAVEMGEWDSTAEADYLDAACAYRGCRHRRRVFFLKPAWLFILDDVELSEAARVEQFWHPAGAVERIGAASFRIGGGTLTLDGPGKGVSISSGGEFGWRSRVYGVKEESPVIVKRRDGAKRVQFGAVLVFPGAAASEALTLNEALSLNNEGAGTSMVVHGAEERRIHFPESGRPETGV